MRTSSDTIQVLDNTWPEYTLLDSGGRQKLERFGSHVIIRSEPKAWWQPQRSAAEWQQAVAVYTDEEQWRFRQPVAHEWVMHFDRLSLLARCTEMSKHVGIFPEQSAHWTWIQAKVRQHQAGSLRVLNLFGYTGVASLVAAQAGCVVTHVDASKPALAWAKRNQELSGLQQAPVRWILDDAIKFVRREAVRQKQYDVLLLDPPSFGRGPKGEVWKIDKQLPQLLTHCQQVLSEQPCCIIITMYAIEASALLIGNLLDDMMHPWRGSIQVGELVLSPQQSGKRLPMAIFGRWESV